MHPNVAILTALVVVLVIVVAYQSGVGRKKKTETPPDGFVASTGAVVPTPYQGGEFNPYTVLNKRLSTIRGARNDGAGNQKPFYRRPRGLDAYVQAGANVKPEQIAEAERQQWYAATASDNTDSFNPELAHEGFTDTMQYHTQAPAIDYDSYITDLVSDPRMRDNHQKWVEEMKPWSGVAMKVDTLEMDNYVDFTGLRRPQAVVQYNPMQLTEIDTNDLAVNPKFNFRG